MTRLSVSEGCLQTDIRILSLIIKDTGSFLTTKWTQEFKKDKESSFYSQAQMGENVFDCTVFFSLYSSIYRGSRCATQTHKQVHEYKSIDACYTRVS